MKSRNKMKMMLSSSFSMKTKQSNASPTKLFQNNPHSSIEEIKF